MESSKPASGRASAGGVDVVEVSRTNTTAVKSTGPRTTRARAPRHGTRVIDAAEDRPAIVGSCRGRPSWHAVTGAIKTLAAPTTVQHATTVDAFLLPASPVGDAPNLIAVVSQALDYAVLQALTSAPRTTSATASRFTAHYRDLLAGRQAEDRIPGALHVGTLRETIDQASTAAADSSGRTAARVGGSLGRRGPGLASPSITDPAVDFGPVSNWTSATSADVERKQRAGWCPRFTLRIQRPSLSRRRTCRRGDRPGRRRDTGRVAFRDSPVRFLAGLQSELLSTLSVFDGARLKPALGAASHP